MKEQNKKHYNNSSLINPTLYILTLTNVTIYDIGQTSALIKAEQEEVS